MPRQRPVHPRRCRAVRRGPLRLLIASAVGGAVSFGSLALAQQPIAKPTVLPAFPIFPEADSAPGGRPANAAELPATARLTDGTGTPHFQLSDGPTGPETPLPLPHHHSSESESLIDIPVPEPVPETTPGGGALHQRAAIEGDRGGRPQVVRRGSLVRPLLAGDSDRGARSSPPSRFARPLRLGAADRIPSRSESEGLRPDRSADVELTTDSGVVIEVSDTETPVHAEPGTPEQGAEPVGPQSDPSQSALLPVPRRESSVSKSEPPMTVRPAVPLRAELGADGPIQPAVSEDAPLEDTASGPSDAFAGDSASPDAEPEKDAALADRFPPASARDVEVVDSPGEIVGVVGGIVRWEVDGVIDETVAEDASVARSFRPAARTAAFVGAHPGTTRIAVVLRTADNARKCVVYRVRVEPDPRTKQVASQAAEMNQAVRAMYPRSQVRITVRGDALVVAGEVPTEAEAITILRMVRQTTLCPVVDQLRAKQ